MPVLDIDELPRPGVLLGLDPGSKTLGVAASDPDQRVAAPITVIRRTKLKADAEALFTLYDARDAVGLVIGLPLNMDGSEGPRVQSARALVRNLLGLRDLAIAFQDERLTTAEAQRAMIAADLSRAKRAAVIDQSAAAIILQTALDRRR
ncbi:MAG: Holliday junction resolvase RuvX [Maricaulaceae bacterium]